MTMETVTIRKLKGRRRQVWIPCIDCGEYRWVDLCKGEPRNLRCLSCSRRSPDNPHWKGGEAKVWGYVYVLKPEHPFANAVGRVSRSRLVLEEKLGRYLKEGYEPHHRNLIRDDDRPENLEELSHVEHGKLHAQLRWQQEKRN